MAEKLFSQEIYYDPDETPLPTEDLKSRCERKFILDYNHDFTRFSLSTALYIGWVDYYNADDHFNIGMIGSVTYQSLHWKSTFKAAPIGDLNQNYGYYQLKLEYIPGKRDN